MNELIKIDSYIRTLDEKSFTILLLYGVVDMTAKQTKLLYCLLSKLFILVNILMDS